MCLCSGPLWWPTRLVYPTVKAAPYHTFAPQVRGPMSGYYFDFREGRLLTPGHTGLELDGVNALERQRAEAAAQIGRGPSSRDGATDVTVEAGSEPSQRMLRVSAS